MFIRKSPFLWIVVFSVFTSAGLNGCRRESPPEPAATESPEAKEIAAEEPLSGKRVAVLVTEGFHDGETLEPMKYLSERGAEITVIGPEVGEVKAYNSDQTVTIEKAVTDVEVEDFDGLIIPGGTSPAALRQDEAVVAFAGEFARSGKPVAAICHGPQVLITAGVMEGRTATCVAPVGDEITEAGGTYVDEPVVRDGNLITSRTPGDLPVFNQAIAEALAE